MKRSAHCFTTRQDIVLLTDSILLESKSLVSQRSCHLWRNMRLRSSRSGFDIRSKTCSHGINDIFCFCILYSVSSSPLLPRRGRNEVEAVDVDLPLSKLVPRMLQLVTHRSSRRSSFSLSRCPFMWSIVFSICSELPQARFNASFKRWVCLDFRVLEFDLTSCITFHGFVVSLLCEFLSCDFDLFTQIRDFVFQRFHGTCATSLS